MKIFLMFAASVFSLLMLAGNDVVADIGTSDPVGFVTSPVRGGGTPSSPVLSLVAPAFVRPAVWQGTIASISGTTINVNGATWTTGQFNGANGEYYVEVFSATKAGVLSDITATGTNTVTTADNLTAFATVGDSIAIRSHVTLDKFLGANNTFGLLASDDGSTADEVLVYDGANHAIYFYFNGAGAPAGWYDLNFNPAGSTIIAPHQGVIIMRKTAGNLAITSMGAVKTGNTLFPVYNGLNVLNTLSPAGLMTLDSSGLYKPDGSQFRASDDPTTGDEVTIYGGNTSVSYFYYTGSPGFPAGWWDSAFTGQAGSVVIPPGSAVIVKHQAVGAFNWSVPAPATQSFVQSSGQPNAGLTLAQGPTVGGFTLSWSAIAGNTYFVQQSSDLVTWEVLPVMESVSGSDQVISWGFNSTADKLFLRLRYTDIPTTDPANTAFAGDGMTTLWKLRNGLDPLVWLDPSGDADGDGISNSLEFQNNTNALKPAPVLTLTVPAGATLVP